MLRMTMAAALCAGLGLTLAGCGATAQVEPSLAASSAAPLITPEPATVPSAGGTPSDRADFAALVWDYSDDGDEASEQELWDLGVTICVLFDSEGTFDDVVSLTDEHAAAFGEPRF